LINGRSQEEIESESEIEVQLTESRLSGGLPRPEHPSANGQPRMERA
jgi:hypothetical protein